MTRVGPALTAVTIAAADPDAAMSVFAQITGINPRPVPGGSALVIGATRLLIHDADGSSSGLVSVAVSVPSLATHLDALRQAGLPVQSRGGISAVPGTFANGIDVAFEGAVQSASHATPTIRARLDHVALVVANLSAAVERWQTLLGLPPAEVGPHPLGDSETARFLLGAQMIELVSPLPGASTAMRRRLETTGDGPIALAVIPDNLETTVVKLESSGVLLVRQPPHIFVHPRRAGGVLVQLTPRLEHRP